MKWKPILRRARQVFTVLLVAELAWVVLANGLLFSGLIQRAATMSTPLIECEMGWTRAWSPWPGRAYVTGFHLRLQDPVLQFRLTVDEAKTDVIVWALLRKTLRLTHVEASGVTFRFVNRVDGTAGREARLAAFPTLEGFARPALLPDPRPPPLTQAEIEALWKVELDDVDAALSEIWILEFRYHGPGRARGAFEYVPLRRFQVKSTLLTLAGGALTVGDHVISDPFNARADVSLVPLDLQNSPGLQVLETLTASIQLDTALQDLGVAELYLDGLHTRGAGRLAADLRVAAGRVSPGSSLELWLPRTDVALDGYHFAGEAHAKLSMLEDTAAPTVHATVGGALTLPVLTKAGLTVLISDLSADLALVNDELTVQPNIRRISVSLGEARVSDARPLTALVGRIVPIFTPFVLGEGPAVASATAWVTPEYTLVRLKHLRLGDAALEGAAVPGAGGWRGAAAGHFGAVPLGLRLTHNGVASALFVPPTWLGAELIDAGIKPEEVVAGRK